MKNTKGVYSQLGSGMVSLKQVTHRLGVVLGLSSEKVEYIDAVEFMGRVYIPLDTY